MPKTLCVEIWFRLVLHWGRRIFSSSYSFTSLNPQNSPFRKSRRSRSKGYFPHGHRDRHLTINFWPWWGDAIQIILVSPVYIFSFLSFLSSNWVQKNALCLIHIFMYENVSIPILEYKNQLKKKISPLIESVSITVVCSMAKEVCLQWPSVEELK